MTLTSVTLTCVPLTCVTLTLLPRDEILVLDYEGKDYYKKLHSKQADISALKKEKQKMKDELAVYQQRLSGLISRSGTGLFDQ